MIGFNKGGSMTNSRFSKSLAAVSCALAILASGCNINFGNRYSFDYGGVPADKTRSGEISTSITYLEIDNIYGDVHIEETGGNGTWTWEATCWADDQLMAEQFLDQLQLEVTTRGDKQILKVVLPKSDFELRGIKSDLSIQVPLGAKVKLANSHGKTSAFGLSKECEFDQAHGNLDLNEINAEAEIKIRHGNVTAKNLREPAEINSSHGHVQISGADESLTIKNRHGNIVVENASEKIETDNSHGKTTIEGSASEITCKSSHGYVEIEFAGSDLASIEVKSSHGGITLVLPPAVQPEFKFDIRHGSIKSDFESSDGNGSGKVKLSSRHGNIKVKSK
jgi:hypothetical protein